MACKVAAGGGGRQAGTGVGRCETETWEPPQEVSRYITTPGGGGRLQLQYARMCVSKSEGHGSLFGLK